MYSTLTGVSQSFARRQQAEESGRRLVLAVLLSSKTPAGMESPAAAATWGTHPHCWLILCHAEDPRNALVSVLH